MSLLGLSEPERKDCFPHAQPPGQLHLPQAVTQLHPHKTYIQTHIPTYVYTCVHTYTHYPHLRLPLSLRHSPYFLHLILSCSSPLDEICPCATWTFSSPTGLQGRERHGTVEISSSCSVEVPDLFDRSVASNKRLYPNSVRTDVPLKEL